MAMPFIASGMMTARALDALSLGHDAARSLVVSALGGSAFLSLADISVRVLFPIKDLKLGVVTALVGVPFFL